MMDELLKSYPGKIRMVWRDRPLGQHKDAPLAAEAAREAHAQRGNEGFTRMQKLLFENHDALKREDLDRYAGILGLDMKKFAHGAPASFVARTSCPAPPRTRGFGGSSTSPSARRRVVTRASRCRG